MRIEYHPARTGESTARVDGRYLHSPYDPRREARRFTEALQLDHPRGTTILIGDGTGIVGSVLRTRFPSMRVISIVPVNGGAAEAPPEQPVPGRDSILCSTDGSPVPATTVRNCIHPLHVSGIQTVTWPGAASLLPDWTRAMERVVLDALRDLQAELATIATFGRLWISNALRRTLQEDLRVETAFHGEGLVIAAAGPRLGALASQAERRERHQVPIVAATSALRWLRHHSFTPAVALHSDGGFWARRYLRDTESCTIGTAVYLRAAPGRLKRSILLQTGWVGEELAPDASAWPFLADQPTVGASLIHMAHMMAPRGHHLLCGLDLCTTGLLSHARPHRNDQYIYRHSFRLNTEEAIRAERAGLGGSATRVCDTPEQSRQPSWQTPTLAAYAEPVSAALAHHRRTGSAWFLQPSPVWTSDPVGPVPHQDLPRGRFSVREIHRPKRSDRYNHASRTVLRWKELMESLANPHELRRDQMDLLLHLAPVAAIQWVRDGHAGEPPRLDLNKALDSILHLVEGLQ